jgi:hypothetical protein
MGLYTTPMMNSDSDFLTRISLAEFHERTGHAYPPVSRFHFTREHWAERSGVLLGVLVLDRIDHDYGYVVLGRDQRDRFRAIEAACSYLSIDKARTALGAAMREIIAGGAAVFPQDCVY